MPTHSRYNYDVRATHNHKNIHAPSALVARNLSLKRRQNQQFHNITRNAFDKKISRKFTYTTPSTRYNFQKRIKAGLDAHPFICKNILNKKLYKDPNKGT